MHDWPIAKNYPGQESAGALVYKPRAGSMPVFMIHPIPLLIPLFRFTWRSKCNT